MYKYLLCLFNGLEQRAIREALAHDEKMREVFADLDTNHDSL